MSATLRILLVLALAFAAPSRRGCGQSEPREEPPPAAPPLPASAGPTLEIDGATVPIRDLVRTEDAPTIDGVLDDAAWKRAVVLDGFLQIEPVEGAEPSERTEVLLLFDEDFLYVAFRCLDRDPHAIIGTQMKRDASLAPDDRIAFIVDPIFNRRNGYFFEMNAVGARGDGLIEDNQRLRKNWDGIWYGKSSIDEHGWYVEIAIPFKTISFNPDTERWGFNATRFIRRRNESVRWASPSRDKSFNSLADAGVLDGIGDINQGVGLDVVPWGSARAKRDHETDEDGFEIDGGLDVFYKLTPSTTLALTINTDFAETEVDERQVNLTRFPLFFPEKRDFFLQDESIFAFGGINRNPLPFHSRQIGLSESGEEQPILAGLKITGRTEALSFGLLDVQMKDDDDLGNKNFFVGRASLNVLQQSTVGAIYTYGDPDTPGTNQLGGVDFNYRSEIYGGTRTLEGHAWGLLSNSSGDDGGQPAYGFKLSYPNDRVSWGIGYSEIDEDFNAALGFVPRPGIREFFGNWRYRWRPERGPIRSIDSGVNLFLVTDLDNDVESRSFDVNAVTIEGQDGDRLRFSYSNEREVLDGPFEIFDGIVLPEDDYRFDRYVARFDSSLGRPVNVGVSYGGGDFYSGTRDDYGVNVGWRPSRHLSMSCAFTMNDVDLDEGDFITRILQGRVNVFFTPDLSWSNLIQYDSVSQTIGINSRVQWIIEPGNVLYVVLNQEVDRDGSSYQVARTELTTKLKWTFRF